MHSALLTILFSGRVGSRSCKSNIVSLLVLACLCRDELEHFVASSCKYLGLFGVCLSSPRRYTKKRHVADSLPCISSGNMWKREVVELYL